MSLPETVRDKINVVIDNMKPILDAQCSSKYAGKWKNIIIRFDIEDMEVYYQYHGITGCGQQ